MSSLEFWQIIYSLAIANGHEREYARELADGAVEDFESFREDTD